MKPSDRVEPRRAGAAGSRDLVRRAGVLSVMAITLVGCATVVRGVHETFEIVSFPTGAHVQLSSGETCTTPCKLDLPRAVAFQARVSLPGYVTQVVPVASRNSVGGAIGFVGNGVVGGIVGAGVDAESGAMRSLSPNPLKVQLVRLPVQNSAQSQ